MKKTDLIEGKWYTYRTYNWNYKFIKHTVSGIWFTERIVDGKYDSKATKATNSDFWMEAEPADMKYIIKHLPKDHPDRKLEQIYELW